MTLPRQKRLWQEIGMAYRKRFLWDKDAKQWLPENEVMCKRRKENESFNFSIYKSGYNDSLGGYCGSKTDERTLCSKIEDRTGSRPEAIGDAKLTNFGTRKEYG